MHRLVTKYAYLREALRPAMAWASNILAVHSKVYTIIINGCSFTRNAYHDEMTCLNKLLENRLHSWLHKLLAFSFIFMFRIKLNKFICKKFVHWLIGTKLFDVLTICFLHIFKCLNGFSNYVFISNNYEIYVSVFIWVHKHRLTNTYV